MINFNEFYFSKPIAQHAGNANGPRDGRDRGKEREMAKSVVVVGAGNAALCAAMAARENGAEVLILEAAPEH